MKRLLIPTLVLLALSPFLTTLDLEFSRYFFENDSFQSGGIHPFIFYCLPIPAYICALIGLGLLFSKKYRKTGQLLSLVLILGSGLLINGVLKLGWGRPRPRQVIEFAGTQEFRPFYKPNIHQPEPSRSFPSGHASSGFYFFTLALAGSRLKNRKVTALGILLTLSLGFTLSYSRIAVGGHFLSDTAMAAYFMWLTAVLVDKWVYREVRL